MQKKIITISREFGSGGRSIGKLVAEKLGYKYYDSELVERVAKETGFSAEYIADAGEYAPGRSMLSYAFSSGTPHTGASMNAADYLWATQCRVIMEIAEKGTEAAAVTVAQVRMTSARPTQYVTMTVNRPYMFFIVDTQNSNVMFAGRVMNL